MLQTIRTSHCDAWGSLRIYFYLFVMNSFVSVPWKVEVGTMNKRIRIMIKHIKGQCFRVNRAKRMSVTWCKPTPVELRVKSYPGGNHKGLEQGAGACHKIPEYLRPAGIPQGRIYLVVWCFCLIISNNSNCNYYFLHWETMLKPWSSWQSEFEQFNVQTVLHSICVYMYIK